MIDLPVQVTAIDPVFNGRSTTKDLWVSTAIGVALTTLSYGVGLAFGWITSVNPVEVVAVLFAYAGTYLCVVQRRVNYPINAVSTAAYCVLFFQQGLLSSAVLNLYLTPALLYGWYRWRSDANPRPVTRVALKWVPVYVGITLVAFAGAALITSALGGQLAWLDASILAGTILAQFLLDNKKIENWIIWVLVDIVAIWEYYHSGLVLAGFQYVLFLLNTVYGLVSWIRTMEK